MQASHSRRLKDGRQYDRLIKKGTGKRTEIKSFPTTEQTVRYMVNSYKSDAWQVEDLAKALKGATLYEGCRNLWHFLYEHVQYRLDPEGVELVRTPAATWREREKGVDCDCFSYFIACVLHHWRAHFAFRRADYGSGWQHVYVVVHDDNGRKIILDPVVDSYNYEHPPKKVTDMSNSLARLDGLPTQSQYGLGKTIVGKILTKVQRVGKDVLQAAGKTIRFVNRYINPATIGLRNGLLLGMKLNVLNVSKRIRYAYWTDAQAAQNGWKAADFAKLKQARERLEKAYESAGGKKENLKKGILTGKGNSDKRVSLGPLPAVEDFSDELEFQLLNVPNSIDPRKPLSLTPIPTKESGGLSGCGCGLSGLGAEPASSAALVALATSAIALVAKMLDVIPFPKKEDTQQLPAESYGVPIEIPQGDAGGAGSGTPKDDTKDNTMLWVGIGVLAAGGIGYAVYTQNQPKKKGKKDE